MAFPVSFDHRQSFCHEIERAIRLAQLAASRGKIGKSHRQSQLCSQARHCSQTVAQLDDSFLDPFLLCLCPASKDSSVHKVERKPLLGRERNRRLGPLLGHWAFSTEVTNPGSE